MSIYTGILTGGSNSHQTTSEEANQVQTDFMSEGVVGTITNTSGVAPATGALAVNAQGTPNMTVAVSSGVAYVQATPSGQASQMLRVYNNASANVTIAANSSGSTKYDWVYLSVSAANAANPNTAGDNVTTLTTSRSSSATSDDGTPPTYGYPLAVVTVANGASSITNGNIADIRVRTGVTSNFPAYNPYKFRGYLNSAQNTTSGAFAKIAMDAENFDTSGNFDTVTNKGRFTAPVAGFYQLNASTNISASGTTAFQVALYKNGSVVAYGDEFNASATGSVQVGVQALLQLAVTDYIEVYVFCNGVVALTTGTAATYFSGFLVSQT